MLFLIINYIESSNIKQTKPALINRIVEVKKTNDTYPNLIIEYLINDSLNDFFEALKDRVDGEFISAILRKYNPKCEEKLLFLVQEMMKRNKITTKYITDKIEEYKTNGEIDDIMEECPIITRFIEKLI